MGNMVRVYASVGEILPGMAYLVRRLLEDIANSGLLRMSYYNNTDLIDLLQEPKDLSEENKSLSKASGQRGCFTKIYKYLDFVQASLI